MKKGFYFRSCIIDLLFAVKRDFHKIVEREGREKKWEREKKGERWRDILGRKIF